MSLLQIAKEGPVTILTIDRAETMNPLGAPGDGDEFARVANGINRDMECRVVILTGAGRAFSAGGATDDTTPNTTAISLQQGVQPWIGDIRRIQAYDTAHNAATVAAITAQLAAQHGVTL
jgi:enoyl-CoA hydratase/carnithine racemase